MRILGIDPGLVHTGWGVIAADRGRLAYVASGRINPPPGADLSDRLRFIFDGLSKIIALHAPTAAAIEETFMNNNAASALKLGQARGAAMLAPATCGLHVAEYGANLVKKSVVGSGHAGKEQVQAMIRILLPKAGELTADQADALAVAICHAHHAESAQRLKQAG